VAAHQEYDETAERILRQRGRSFQVLTPIELGSHYFKMGQAVGCDKFAVANAGTPVGSKNGVPALRLSHSTKYSDSTNALPLLIRSLASSRDRVRIAP
jgi:hypothetical protein